MALTAQQELDLIALTLPQLGEGKWTDNISSIVKFIFVNNIFKKEKIDFQGGPFIRWNVMVTPSTAAKMTGMIGPKDNVNVIDHMALATCDWRRGNTNWGIDAVEMSMNSGSLQLVNLLKERRAAAFTALAELIETQGWSQPTDTNDKTNSFGIPTWIVPNRTQGFNGGNPFGFTTGIGLDSTVYTNWANWTDSYTVPDKLDLVRKMKKAAYRTDFEAPVEAAVPTYSTGANKRGIYTTEVIGHRLDEVAQQQNDNLGKDVAEYDGMAHFKRIPITMVPKLDVLSGSGAAGATGKFVNATYTSSGGMPVQPVYMIDWGTMGCAFLSGWYLREHGPYIVPGQSTTYAVQVYFVWNPLCRDRRRNAVLTQ